MINSLCKSINKKIDLTEKHLAKIECDLAWGTALPFTGVFPGAVKIGLGVLQTVSAIALAAFTILTTAVFWNKEAQNLCKKSIKHIAHGIANIIGGAIESIPGIGLAVFQIIRAKDSPSFESFMDKSSSNNATIAYDPNEYLIFKYKND